MVETAGEVPPERHQAGEHQEERIQVEASQQEPGAYSDLRGLAEIHKFAALHHKLRCYSTPQQLSFLKIRDP